MCGFCSDLDHRCAEIQMPLIPGSMSAPQDTTPPCPKCRSPVKQRVSLAQLNSPLFTDRLPRSNSSSDRCLVVPDSIVYLLTFSHAICGE